MQTRKNKKNKSKKWYGGGPKSNISKNKSKKTKSKSPEKKIEKIASAEKINIHPIPLSKSPQSPSFFLSLLPNKKKEYENKKIERETKKENNKKYEKLNEIYGGFFEKLNELIVLFKSVDTDYINDKKLQSIIDSYNNVKANIVDGLKLYHGITNLENEPDINIDNLITERQNYIDKIEGYKTKINKIIERINQAKAEEIKKEEEDAIKRRLEEEEKKRKEEEKKQKEEEYKKKKTAKKEEKKAATKIERAATKIQSFVRGRTSRKRYNIKTMRESAKKKQALMKMIDKTPQEITREEWSAFFKENVNQIKEKIRDINSIIEKNETNGFREDYRNKGAKYYSHVIFFILGFLTPLLEKKGVTMYLKGGQAIHLNKQTSTYPDYKSNDIDIDFIVDPNSNLKKIDVCYMIRNFIYWCVSDNDIVNIENIKYSKNLTSIENETNVLKMSFREFPTSGQIFALMDMSFKDGLPDIKKLFTRDYLERKEFEINGISHRYNYQSLLSLILEKIFILLHTDDAMIAIKDKPDIINKFKETLQYTLQLYIAQPENTTEKISTEYSKLFNVDEKAIQEFINDVLYPEKREQQKQEERELERQKQELEREENRKLESLIATLLNNIRTFQTKYENLFNNLSNNCPVNNVNATIDFSLTEMNKIPTLEEKKNYILNKLRTNVVENINKYLKNEKCSKYLERNKNINLKKVIHEWNDITNIHKYKPLSQGMPPLRQPTYI